MKKIFLTALGTTLLLTSCFKQESENMECDITAASVENTGIFSDPSQAKADIPKSYADDYITFGGVKKGSDLTKLRPILEITEGATVQPESGSEHDFSNGAMVKYTVTSEDRNHERNYFISFSEGFMNDSVRFHFEDFALDSKGKYYEWNELEDWTTGKLMSANAGFGVANSKAAATDYPTTPCDEGYKGKCIKLTTRDTGSFGRMTKKPLAAGNLFVGKFDLSKALTNTLQSTQFGIPIYENRRPKTFCGYYKYQPGAQITDKDMQPLSGTDTGACYALIYKNKDENGNKIVLTGEDVDSSPYVVAKAEVTNMQVTTEWVHFELPFVYTEELDASTLARQGYNLAIVCSSSKNGARYEGALGSTLWLDELLIVNR